MPQLPTLVDMLKAGVHFGHLKSKWHPKMSQYIYSVRHNIHILDLEHTAKQLESVLGEIRKTVAAGGQVLFVSIKKQATVTVREAAERTGMPYIVDRWLGGVFTNWGVVSKLIQRLDKLESEQTRGLWAQYSKKEQLEMQKDMERLMLSVGGIRNMTKLPAMVFLVGVREGKNAINEANKAKVPVVGIVDTDTNPTKVGFPIPANDDALKSVQLIVDLVALAVEEGKQEALAHAAPVQTV